MKKLLLTTAFTALFISTSVQAEGLIFQEGFNTVPAAALQKSTFQHTTNHWVHNIVGEESITEPTVKAASIAAMEIKSFRPISSNNTNDQFDIIDINI